MSGQLHRGGGCKLWGVMLIPSPASQLPGPMLRAHAATGLPPPPPGPRLPLSPASRPARSLPAPPQPPAGNHQSLRIPLRGARPRPGYGVKDRSWRITISRPPGIGAASLPAPRFTKTRHRCNSGPRSVAHEVSGGYTILNSWLCDGVDTLNHALRIPSTGE